MLSDRGMVVLGVLVVLANLSALVASIGYGTWGLVPTNLLGIGMGVWVTCRLPGVRRLQPHEQGDSDQHQAERG